MYDLSSLEKQVKILTSFQTKAQYAMPSLKGKVTARVLTSFSYNLIVWRVCVETVKLCCVSEFKDNEGQDLVKGI